VSGVRVSATPAAKMSDADFERFREWFYRRTGIQFATTKRYFVDKRIAACIEDAGAPSFAAWFARIRLGGEQRLELQLINRLTVHETYFLREDYQFQCLTASALPEIMKTHAPGTPVRILSLPCSTGEEPYSIAIWLLEQWSQIDDVDVEIGAMDIDAESVTTARAGVYGARALQRISVVQSRRWFKPVGNGEHQISADLRGAVRFAVGNVCDTQDMRRFRDYDVIFCRNLLIYFDEQSARRAAENLFGMLRPGGLLFLGHSESMSRVSSIFEPVRFADATVYRRPREDVA
jgi:chemotaxis protein methyltransferase CheR